MGAGGIVRRKGAAAVAKEYVSKGENIDSTAISLNVGIRIRKIVGNP